MLTDLTGTVERRLKFMKWLAYIPQKYVRVCTRVHNVYSETALGGQKFVNSAILSNRWVTFYWQSFSLQTTLRGSTINYFLKTILFSAELRNFPHCTTGWIELTHALRSKLEQLQNRIHTFFVIWYLTFIWWSLIRPYIYAYRNCHIGTVLPENLILFWQ